MGEVVYQNCPTSPIFKLREKWFYIGYIERIFLKADLSDITKTYFSLHDFFVVISLY